MIKEAQLFEDFHALAHRLMQYHADHSGQPFKEFLREHEPGHWQRLWSIFKFAYHWPEGERDAEDTDHCTAPPQV